MASKDAEELLNTETDEETIAQTKKRLRRVSFADREITSVHIFNRDEDYETPQDSSARKPSSADEKNEVLGFFRDLAADSDESREMSPEDDDEIVSRKSFLRPIESPSPGSGTIGSATSNDEDNFFGPVSASFIRPRRLSDSATSDDNHDVTMDSTAFSMHFHSLVTSESGDVKTPTGFHLAFEEKTPNQVTPSDPGSFMVLTKAKKPIMQTLSTSGKVSGSRDSNDMSLVGEKPCRYDYGRLSPELENLLAEGSQKLLANALIDSVSNTKSLQRSEFPIFSDNGNESMDRQSNRDSDICNVGPDNICTEGLPMVQSIVGEVNGDSKAHIIDQITHNGLSDTNDDIIANSCTDHHVQIPNQPNKACIEAETRMSMLNVEFPVAGSDNLPDVNGNSVCRLALLPQHKTVDLSSTENLFKENIPTDGMHNSHIDRLPVQQIGSPLSCSITSLSAKRKQIFLDTTNSSRHLSYATPSPKQPDTFLRMENIKVGESVSSIHKSHSMYNSALTYALRDGIEKSKRRLSEHLSSAASPVKSVTRDPQCQHMDASVMKLEKYLVSVDSSKEELKITPEMNGYSCGGPKNIDNLNQNEEITGLVKDEEPLNHLSDLIPCEDKLTEMMAGMASPAQLTSAGKLQRLLSPNNLMLGSLGVSRSDISSVEITLDHRKDQKANNDSDNIVSPPTKSLDQTLLSPVKFQGSFCGTSKQQDQYKNLVNDSGLDLNSTEYVTSCSHLTGKIDKLDSFSLGWRMQFSSPLLNTDHVKDFTQVKSRDDTSTLEKASEIIKNLQNFSKDIDLTKSQLSSPNKNLQIANDQFLSKEELPGEGIKACPCVPASPYVQRIVNELSHLKSPTRNEPTWSPSGKEQGDSSLRYHTYLFDSKRGLSSMSNSDEHGNGDHCQELNNSQSPFSLQDIDKFSRRKRKGEEIVLGDANNASNINWIQRSPKVHKHGGTDLELLLERSNGSKKANKKIGGDTTLKKWPDILLKFSTETNQILSPLIEKLNRRAIGALEEILVRFQKVNKYEMLYSQFLSQKIYDHSSNIKHKRVAETQLLLYKIVYEKAMLQIMRMKHEKLLKRGQLLKPGIQKFQILKLNCVRLLSAPVKRDSQVDDNLHVLSLINFRSKHECQVACDEVTTMRQEVESLDGKTKSLVKSFHTYCKMKGEVNCDNAIVLLNDQLKKRLRCRSMRQDLLLWEINDLETSNANHSLVLDYRGFICQRFTKTSRPVSSMVISNKVNDMKIMKNFPNMDACVAFAFVFNGESTKKSVGSKSLAQETQTTCSLLGNLLAIVEEVQLARIENRNLTHTSFNSPSAEQLNLLLGFINFNSGRKVAMTLDVTCLNRGVYPSEIVPYQLELSSARMQKAPPESLSSAIKAAITNLTIGYTRIIRLCSCVSQVV